MGAKKKQVSEEVRIEMAVEKARTVMDTVGNAPAGKLGAPAIREQVISRLLDEGFERAGKGVRVPLVKQGRRLMDGGAHIPLTMWKKRLAGASAKEGDQLAKQLCKEGLAHLVLRDKQLSLVPADEGVAYREDLLAITRELKRTYDWLEKARKDKKGATVLDQDLKLALSELQETVAEARKSWGAKAGSPGPGGAPGSSGPLSMIVRGAILAARDEESLLAPVPEVSRRLRSQANAEEVRDALLAGHQQGHWELRPEGGLGRLSEADTELCPRGVGGLPLSFVRLKEN